jgi:DNA-binding Xre family transcriptional regulator
MYTDFSRLWGLLAEKKISKTELIALTGISSRVLAKLVKNETVTTETVARICAALDCRVEDIMECVPEERMSLFDAYRRLGRVTEEGEALRRIELSHGGRRYAILETRARATRGTHIHCRPDGSVVWEQLYPFGGMSAPSSEERVLGKPRRGAEDVLILLVRGRPAIITGLDEGSFTSCHAWPRRAGEVLVLSETAFKLLSVPSEMQAQQEKEKSYV